MTKTYLTVDEIVQQEVYLNSSRIMIYYYFVHYFFFQYQFYCGRNIFQYCYSLFPYLCLNHLLRISSNNVPI